jgi:hypothetical protein
MADDVDFINAVLEDWSTLTLGDLQASVRAAGLELTEDLYNSLRVEVVKATAENIASAKFYFRMHGRMKDMRTVYSNFNASWRQSGYPPISAIEEFIKKTGLEKFKFIPGYKMGTMPTESNAIRRLAWGISIGIGKRNTVKAKKWYAKTFYSQLNPLLEELGRAAREKTAQTIKENLEK